MNGHYWKAYNYMHTIVENKLSNFDLLDLVF